MSSSRGLPGEPTEAWGRVCIHPQTPERGTQNLRPHSRLATQFYNSQCVCTTLRINKQNTHLPLSWLSNGRLRKAVSRPMQHPLVILSSVGWRWRRIGRGGAGGLLHFVLCHAFHQHERHEDCPHDKEGACHDWHALHWEVSPLHGKACTTTGDSGCGAGQRAVQEQLASARGLCTRPVPGRCVRRCERKSWDLYG